MDPFSMVLVQYVVSRREGGGGVGGVDNTGRNGDNNHNHTNKSIISFIFKNLIKLHFHFS